MNVMASPTYAVVAEVASVGGYVQQYQIDVDPNKLRGYSIPLSTVVEAVLLHPEAFVAVTV